jgi:DNA invertase Pin-like site-specific DNA recombinase
MIKNRPGLDEALSHLRKGDTLIVWKLDRLGRSLKDLLALIERFEKSEIQFKSLTDGINTTTAMGRFFFNVMGSLAQMERELLIERTRAGLIAARERGRVGGRKKALTPAKNEAAQKLLDNGTPRKDVAASLEISIPTLYRYFPGTGKKL